MRVSVLELESVLCASTVMKAVRLDPGVPCGRRQVSSEGSHTALGGIVRTSILDQG